MISLQLYHIMAIKLLFFTGPFSISKTELRHSQTLYDERVLKIDEMSEWLNHKIKSDQNKLSGHKNEIRKIDPLAQRTLNTALDIFFNRKYLDSLPIEFEDADSIAAKSMGIEFLKGTILDFMNTIKFVKKQNLLFSVPEELKNCSSESLTDRIRSNNSIDMFCRIGGDRFDLFGFVFEENSTKLVALIPYSFEASKYKLFVNHFQGK